MDKERRMELNTKEYLSVKEVSQLLGVNEKKIYSLVQNGQIPGTKVTGKWLFPKKDLASLLRKEARKTIQDISREFDVNRQIILMSGSDDPILYLIQGIFHQQHPDFVLFSSSVGSATGLQLLRKGFCNIALSHLYDPTSDDYTFPSIRSLFDNPDELVVVNLFHRNTGFVSKGDIKSLSDIIGKKLRFINRQPGSGIRFRVDDMLASEGLDKGDIRGYEDEVFTHLDVVARIVNGSADVGIAAESVARYAHLYFHKIFEERFDMVIYKEAYFEQSIQVFVDFIRSEVFKRNLRSMKGYDGRDTGKIMYER